MTVAYVFPGQGSQAVGMGKLLAAHFSQARQVFDEVDAALGQKLAHLMFEGPEAELTLTANAQPALMAVSIAVLRVLQGEAGLDLKHDARFLAGHSLGEYSALCAGGALTLADTARLLRIRGDAMQKAVPAGAGAMAALIGLEFGPVAALATEAARADWAIAGVCQAANDNGGGPVVISGTKHTVERAMELAKAKGAKRAILLPVSAPFHCELMAPAAAVMQEALAKVAVRAPLVPVVANVTALPVSDPDDIRKRLVEQVTGTVRWRESVAYMAHAGVSHFYELGSGKVLSGLVKRIAAMATGTAVGTPDDVVAYRAGGK